VKKINVLDLPDDARDLVRECEVSGGQTLFERNGRAVAILVSHDEYLALRETIEITNDAPLRAKVEAADELVKRGEVALAEDLFE
jgi:PHD/YefM family antitoxin component YafN of YafNO toxin-antitoxin module